MQGKALRRTTCRTPRAVASLCSRSIQAPLAIELAALVELPRGARTRHWSSKVYIGRTRSTRWRSPRNRSSCATAKSPLGRISLTVGAHDALRQEFEELAFRLRSVAHAFAPVRAGVAVDRRQDQPALIEWPIPEHQHRMRRQVQEHRVRAGRQVHRGVLTAEHLDPTVFRVKAPTTVEDRAGEVRRAHRNANDGDHAAENGLYAD